MNLPDPIVKVTKTGEAITMEAISESTYEKCHFDNYEIGKPLMNPRKTKLVNIDSSGFSNMYDLFENLIKTEGYISIPQTEKG